ncbi:MAG: DUF2238 domain-containing protein [archaeon]
MKKTTLVKIFSVLLVIVIFLTGIKPASRTVWFLEVLLVFITTIILLSTYNKFQFSKTSYTLIFILLIACAIGAMYTYEKVPYEGLKDILGTERNPYDRIVHFAFGLFLYYPLLELFVRTSKLKHKFWMYFVPLIIIIGLGAIYEITEWAVAINIDAENASAFLGMQGDEWDAQKDMIFNTLGAILTMWITMVATTFKTRSIDPNF